MRKRHWEIKMKSEKFRRNENCITVSATYGEKNVKTLTGFETLLELNFALFLSLFLFSCTHGKAFASADTLQNKLILTNDSGFVTKKEGLAFLLANSLTDTLPWSDTIYYDSPITLFDGTTHTYWIDNGDDGWYLFKQTDTIGKYYRIENSNNYMMCLIDYGSKYDFETHLVIEITSDGKLVKSERFFHGNYPCCWGNNYDGFSKYGDFFGIEICGTGSGYCASYLHLFKEVTPQDSINSIRLNCWAYIDSDDDEASYASITSNMEIKKDELLLHYVLIYGTLDENYGWGKIHSSEKFAIRYFYKNGKWDTEDKDKLKVLMEWCL